MNAIPIQQKIFGARAKTAHANIVGQCILDKVYHRSTLSKNIGRIKGS